MGLCVLSLPKLWEWVLYLIIIIKSEVWTINHCLGLVHKTMVHAVCLTMFLRCIAYIYINLIFSEYGTHITLRLGSKPKPLTNDYNLITHIYIYIHILWGCVMRQQTHVATLNSDWWCIFIKTMCCVYVSWKRSRKVFIGRPSYSMDGKSQCMGLYVRRTIMDFAYMSSGTPNRIRCETRRIHQLSSAEITFYFRFWFSVVRDTSIRVTYIYIYIYMSQ